MGRIAQLIVILLLGAGAALAGPRVECAAPAYDFGSVSSTSVVSHVFVIANTGDAPLKIDGVRVCCGATADLATNVVAVGTNTTLRVNVSMHGKQGQVERAFYVTVNDSATPLLRLTFTGSVL